MSRDRPFHLDEAREALDQAYADLDTLRSDLARVTAERDAAVGLAYIGDHRFPDLAWKARAEELIGDIAALKAEVEAMGAVLMKLADAHHMVGRCMGCGKGPGDSTTMNGLCRSCTRGGEKGIDRALDALRTRKGGG